MIVTNLLANVVFLSFEGVITNNAPALQQYAVHAMFTNARAIAAGWHLDERLIATNSITRFVLKPFPDFIEASMTFADRYTFTGNTLDCVLRFVDEPYCSDVLYRTDRSTSLGGPPFVNEIREADVPSCQIMARRWLASTNHLTLAQAEIIARQALCALGPSGEKLAKNKPKTKEQLFWTDRFSGGKVFVDRHEALRQIPLGSQSEFSIVDLPDGRFRISGPADHRSFRMPYYTFRWELHTRDGGFCDIDVSGITGRIARSYFALPKPKFGLAMPTNYFGMLGLPPDASFVAP